MRIRGQQVYSHEERIRRMIQKDANGCWNWTGSTRNGYGRLVIGSRTLGSRKSVSAHRLSHEVFIGPIPEGLEVCHRCDNRRCVNPDHLFAGTKQDNMDDRDAKGRNNPPKGEACRASRLTETDVISMRRLRASGWSYKALADRFDVSKKTAIQACKCQSWKHVEDPSPPTK